MIFKWPSATMRRAPYLVWHSFFSIWPRRIGGRIAWLEWIERKGMWCNPYSPALGAGYYGRPHMIWRYRKRQDG